jgi:hypothetical protein
MIRGCSVNGLCRLRAAVILLVAGAEVCTAAAGDSAKTKEGSMTWTLTSAAFENGQRVPKQNTGDGEDLSPPLAWTEPPAGTRELALVVDDPDAPSAEPWVHWVLYKIPSETRQLPAGLPGVRTLPSPGGAAQGKNSWGGIGWRGPAPPRGHGTHRYFFKLLALDTRVALDPGADKRALLAAAKGHVLAEAQLLGTYSR